MDFEKLITMGFGHVELQDLSLGLSQEIKELESAPTDSDRLLELVDVYGYVSAIKIRTNRPVLRERSLEIMLIAKIGLRQGAYRGANVKRAGYRNPQKLGINYDKHEEDTILLQIADSLSFSYSSELFKSIIENM